MSTEHVRSRRSILGASLAGLAGYVAAALPHPHEAAAASGDPVLVDQTANGGGTTKVSSAASGNVAFSAFVGEATDGVSEVYGLEGISASTAGGAGVRGRSTAGYSGIGVVGLASGDASLGVYGRADSQGVQGRSDAIEGKGVIGVATDESGELGPFGVWGEVHGPAGVGVVGYSGFEGFSYPSFSVGVYGTAKRDNKARAVWGSTTVGTGVRGDATTGTGVRATATSGTALAVDGRVTFSRAGRASIPKNASYVDVTVPGGLASSAFIVATLQIRRTGIYVSAVRPNHPSSGKARIYLNKVASTTASTPVGWIVIG